MKTQQKQAIASIIFIVILAISTIMATATAHDPPQSFKTFALLSASPANLGVGQQMEIYMWLSLQPPTAQGAYGDRWQGYSLTITRPDGTTENLGPFSSDPIGFAWTLYNPTQVGIYTFQFSFPGQTLAGDNLIPGTTQGVDYIGDYFEPSTSNIETVTVQQDPVPAYPDTPVTTDQWTRPIFPENREWWSISGNWLESPPSRNDLPFAPYTKGPETSHILWTKPLTIGGLVGGEFGETSYYSGNAYEGQWFPPVIINGMLYYNKYPSDTYYGSTDGGTQYPRRAPLPGFYCVDLRTGEEVWYNNDTRIDFGQIYRYDSPNQHGAVAYLWSMQGSTWVAYDAFTGAYMYTINNVPSGSQTSSSDGSILRYQLNANGHWLACWNSSAIPELLGAEAGTQNWQWRPYGKTVDGRTGYSWNISIPAEIQGSISYVFAGDRIIGSSGLGRTGVWLNLGTNDYSVWCLSLKQGEEGKLLWKKDYTGPGGLTLYMEAANTEAGVFTLWSPESRQHWGYSLDDGAELWGPTESQNAWDFTVGTIGNIAYGKLFTRGYSGIIYCYDAKTGNLDWTWEATPEYLGEAKWSGRYLIDIAFIADGKIYAVSGEHSPDDPKERGAPMACIDIATGQELWKIPFYAGHWSNNPAIADGIIVFQNSYDNQIYAIGKGPTATTVSAPQTAVPKGTSLMITGMVTDQSEGAKGSPAISDADMDSWMQYMYMQQPIPATAKGVQVKLTAVNSNGATTDIGTVTSDMSGMFKKMWTPAEEGEYTIIATFEGSGAYYASYAETAVGVSGASNASPTQPEPTTPGTAQTETYLIMAAVAIIAIVVIIAALVMRRRK